MIDNRIQDLSTIKAISEKIIGITSDDYELTDSWVIRSHGDTLTIALYHRGCGDAYSTFEVTKAFWLAQTVQWGQHEKGILKKRLGEIVSQL